MSDNPALEPVVRAYVRQGYIVVSRTGSTAQLLKRKSFNFLIALILFILGVVPGVIYILWYMAAKDESLYLEVDAKGHVKKTRA